MTTPGCFDQQDWLVKMISHNVAEFQFDTSAIRRAVTNRQSALSLQKLDEDVVTDNPLVVLSKMSKQGFGFIIRGLVIKQCVGSFSFHVGLPREDKDSNSL